MKKYLSNYYLLLLFLSLWIGLVSCSEEKTTDSILSPPEWIHGIWVSEDELSYVFTADGLTLSGFSVKQDVISISDKKTETDGIKQYEITATYPMGTLTMIFSQIDPTNTNKIRLERSDENEAVFLNKTSVDPNNSISPPGWIQGTWSGMSNYVFTADNLEINGVSVRQNVINISDEERDEFGKTVYFISLYRHDHYETWTFTQDTVNTISLENYMSIGDIDDPTIIEDSDTLIKQPN